MLIRITESSYLPTTPPPTQPSPLVHWSLQELANVLSNPACIHSASARASAPRRLRHPHQGVREDRIVRRAGPGGHGRGAETGVLRPEAVAVLHRPARRGVGLDRTDAHHGA